jgi:hypothetical protein
VVPGVERGHFVRVSPPARAVVSFGAAAVCWSGLLFLGRVSERRGEQQQQQLCDLGAPKGRRATTASPH